MDHEDEGKKNVIDMPMKYRTIDLSRHSLLMKKIEEFV
jgi:hypothetical protein